MQRCVGDGKNITFYNGQGIGDFYIIPQSLRQTFIDVMSVFGRYHLFLEIAIPTFHQCFIGLSMAENLELCTSWGRDRYVLSSYENNCGDAFPLFHPIKISERAGLLVMKRKMNLTDG
jgi:hypothetical protein